MDGAEVAITALGIMASVVGALVWLLRKLFTQNESVLAKLAGSIDGLHEFLKEERLSRTERDTLNEQFQTKVIDHLDHINTKTSAILVKADRNYEATIANQQVGTQVVENQTIVGGSQSKK